MRIGVLALQGAFIEHVQALQQLGVEAVELRQLPDLEQPLDGIVLPGGEYVYTAAEKNSAGLAGTGNLRRYDSVGGKADERQQGTFGNHADYREAQCLRQTAGQLFYRG